MKYTYLSVLSTDNYLPGVLVLNKALKELDSKYPYTVLVTSGVSTKTVSTLVKNNIRVIRKTQRILLDSVHQKKNENVGYKYWNYTFDSLYIFEMTEFEKIVYLDCDILPLINLDHLFDYPHLSACKDPGTVCISSGIMVVVPKEGELKKLLDAIPRVMSKKFYFGDQNIIQECYSEWSHQEEKHLDDKYNAYVGYLNCFIYKGYTYKGNGNNIAIVHFLGPKKPWMYAEDDYLSTKDEYLKRGNHYGIDAFESYFELMKQSSI